MDVALGKVHLPTFRNDSGLSGQGVLLGVIDTGIDPNHPDFQGRILRVWDQTLPGPGVQEGGYGVELTGPFLSVSRDTVGHGTHVAGIATGTGAIFGGVVPQAELVIVKTSFQTAHIADAVRYIHRIARELGRPVVMNLSLGGHADAHDGSDPLSEIIDSESGPGCIICCAAGNEGNDDIHAQGYVATMLLFHTQLTTEGGHPFGIILRPLIGLMHVLDLTLGKFPEFFCGDNGN